MTTSYFNTNMPNQSFCGLSTQSTPFVLPYFETYGHTNNICTNSCCYNIDMMPKIVPIMGSSSTPIYRDTYNNNNFPITQLVNNPIIHPLHQNQQYTQYSPTMSSNTSCNFNSSMNNTHTNQSEKLISYPISCQTMNSHVDVNAYHYQQQSAGKCEENFPAHARQSKVQPKSQPAKSLNKHAKNQKITKFSPHPNKFLSPPKCLRMKKMVSDDEFGSNYFELSWKSQKKKRIRKRKQSFNREEQQKQQQSIKSSFDDVIVKDVTSSEGDEMSCFLNQDDLFSTNTETKSSSSACPWNSLFPLKLVFDESSI